jgi:hypothetical protein
VRLQIRIVCHGECAKGCVALLDKGKLRNTAIQQYSGGGVSTVGRKGARSGCGEDLN